MEKARVRRAQTVAPKRRAFVVGYARGLCAFPPTIPNAATPTAPDAIARLRAARRARWSAGIRPADGVYMGVVECPRLRHVP